MKLILLIDDSEEIRVTFGTVLRKEGYRVIEAESGDAGLQLARQQKPDLILTDINMPGGSGEALLHQVRNDADLCSKQVVLMTGRPDMVSARRGMEEGADDFLVKPVSRSALLACMKARLDRGDLHWRVEDKALAKLQSSMTSQLPHEFFTPLAGILGLSELLSDDLASFSTAETLDLIKDIHQSAQRLHHTLKNYLLILQPSTEDGKGKPPGVLSPAAQFECLKKGVEAAVERNAQREGLAIECESGPILVSVSDLALIVEELVDNALKFSGRGTPIIVRLEKDGALVVTDSGRGMTPAEIARIGAFRQFERGKYEQQGLGLGLCLVQKLAAGNGASFSLEQKPEPGLRARVQFGLAT